MVVLTGQALREVEPALKDAPQSLAWLLLATQLAACGAGRAGEKGGLIPLPVDRETLDRAHEGRKLALVIGIGEFEDAEWRPLRFARKDAHDVAALFTDPRRGAFAKVLSATQPEQVTRRGLDAAFAALAAEARSPDDTVVIYVSSHGTLARDPRGELRRYLVARDSKLSDVPGTALSMDELKARFEALPSRKKLLVLATCHSGTGKSLLPADVQRELAATKAGFFVRPLEEASKASIILSACDWGETAREDEKLENDIYTHFFVQALTEGLDRNGDGAVTATEAHDHARRKTWEFTSGRQRPSAETTLVGVDPIALVGSFHPGGQPELFSYASNLEGFQVRVDGRELGELPGGMALKEGVHHVQISKGGATPLLDSRVELAAGQRIAIEDLLVKEAPTATVSLRLGAQSVVGQGATPAFGISLARKELPLPKLSLVLDASLARRSAGSAMTFAVATPYTHQRGSVQLSFGPRLAALLVRGTDASFAITPGVALGAALALTERLELSASANLHYLLQGSQGAGFGELWAGVGFRL